LEETLAAFARLVSARGAARTPKLRYRARIACRSAACTQSHDPSSKFGVVCGEWNAARKIPLAGKGGNAMFSASMFRVIREVASRTGLEVEAGGMRHGGERTATY
jgi:hypothetical protein